MLKRRDLNEKKYLFERILKQCPCERVKKLKPSGWNFFLKIRSKLKLPNEKPDANRFSKSNNKKVLDFGKTPTS